MAGLPFTGQVTDAKTGEPIDGVIVVALWKGEVNPIADSTQVCYHVETAVSDDYGKYRIPGWFGGGLGIMGSYIVTEAYKKGYERVPVNNMYSKNEVKMASFSGTKKERLELLSKLSISGCSSSEKINKELVLFNKSIFSEAIENESSRFNKELLRSIKINLDIVELGADATHKRIGEGRYSE